MDKKNLILGIATLVVGLTVCFIGPKVAEDPTMICVIGSIISLVGTQTIAQFVLSHQNDNDK